MPKTDKRRRIMHAVERLFKKRSVHEITLDEVARLAHVGKGTLYLYFRDKDDLFFQTATSGFDELCELLSRRVPDDAPFDEQLLGACTEISTFFEKRFQVFRMMQTEAGRTYWLRPQMRSRWQEKAERLVAVLAGIIGKGVTEKSIRDDIPCEVLARFLLGLLRTRGHELREGSGVFGGYELVVELFHHGAARRELKEEDS